MLAVLATLAVITADAVAEVTAPRAAGIAILLHAVLMTMQ